MSFVVSPLLSRLINNFSILDERGFPDGEVGRELRVLRELLPMFCKSAEDAERRQKYGWLRVLKGVAFDADDVVEMEILQALRWPPMRSKEVRDFFSSRHGRAHRINQINSKLMKLKDYAIAILSQSVSERQEERDLYPFFLQPEEDGEVDGRDGVKEKGGEVYGRDGDQEKVIHLLLTHDDDDDDDQDVTVLAVFGEGGVGKTTLARTVYNDASVRNHFDLRLWVSVGKHFDVLSILSSVAEVVTDAGLVHSSDIDTIKRIVSIKLIGRRFLLVLDDFSKVDPQKWNAVKTSLRSGIPGSKIVVTTRNFMDAQMMGRVIPYKLKPLSDDACWTLLKERAFEHYEAEVKEIPSLLEIAREVVLRCNGLPLAVQVLGSLMSLKRNETAWSMIPRTGGWAIYYHNYGIRLAMRLSYDFMPPPMKQCFAYCSIFSKDCRIDKQKVIQLWISEGFIQSSSGSEDLEDIGGRYFNYMLEISLFQDEEKDDYGNIVSCKMHDLTHDCASFVAGKESCIYSTGIHVLDECYYFHVISDDGLSPGFLKHVTATSKLRSLLLSGQTEHLAQEIEEFIACTTCLRAFQFCGFSVLKFPDSIRKLQHLRFLDLSNTMIQEVPESITDLYYLQFLNLSNTKVEVLPEFIASLHNLRTLNLKNCAKIRQLPSTIGKLHNLRLLDLSHSSIQALPESITGLTKLQILNLSNCSELRELPKGTRDMINLNHLDISGCELTCMPCDIGRLHRLQTLPTFLVGKKSGCTIAELKHLNKIRGTLKITCLSNVKDPVKVMEANLAAKAGLHSLEYRWRTEWIRQWVEVVIDWAASTPPLVENMDADVFENLRPHTNVRHLTIEDYGGSRFPTWLAEKDQLLSFSGLESFSLYNIERCESLPPLGQLPSLMHLQVESMYALKRMDNLGGSFLSLRYLKLWNLPGLEEWFVPNSHMFPSLETLIVAGCPKLKIQPHMPSSLLELELESVTKELLGECLFGLSRLRKLKLAHFEESESGWHGLQYLTALKELEIMNCYMVCLPDCITRWHFRSLWTLKLTLNNDLTLLGNGTGGEPPIFFSELRYLKVQGCDELTALPEWLGRLNFLQTLELAYCDNLEMLPHKLPPGLTSLTICGCPLLKRKCERDVGEDWHKICHILEIQTNSTASSDTEKTLSFDKDLNWISFEGGMLLERTTQVLRQEISQPLGKFLDFLTSKLSKVWLLTS